MHNNPKECGVWIDRMAEKWEDAMEVWRRDDDEWKRLSLLMHTPHSTIVAHHTVSHRC